jgi:hypothetical protein
MAQCQIMESHSTYWNSSAQGLRILSWALMVPQRPHNSGSRQPVWKKDEQRFSGQDG